MSNLRLLIVDDEPLIRSGIRSGLSSVEGVEVVGECDCGGAATEAILSRRPDLVLLDIQMPDCSGFDIVRQVGAERMPAVIFVTAYDEYAVQAFEINAVDYLLKPFDEERLRESIERARDRIEAQDREALGRQLESLLEARAHRWPERLVVRNGDRFDFVPVDTVDWIESANNYVHLHCGGRNYLMGETLTSLGRRLDPEMFLRVHRCHIVNISRIVAVDSLMSGVYELELRGGVRLRTGRQYRNAVQELMRI